MAQWVKAPAMQAWLMTRVMTLEPCKKPGSLSSDLHTNVVAQAYLHKQVHTCTEK